MHPGGVITADASRAGGSAPASRAELAEWAAAQQRKYREKRRRYAWRIGRPYRGDLSDPDPGVLDVADEEQG